MDTGARVLAGEPVDAMRAVLADVAPRAGALGATAEALPLEDGSVDVVTVAQAFHWFDGRAALDEIHRVLRPGGWLALVWNRRELDHPLHREISRIIDPHRGDPPSHHLDRWRIPLTESTAFEAVEAIERLARRHGGRVAIPYRCEVQLFARLD